MQNHSPMSQLDPLLSGKIQISQTGTVQSQLPSSSFFGLGTGFYRIDPSSSSNKDRRTHLWKSKNVRWARKKIFAVIKQCVRSRLAEFWVGQIEGFLLSMGLSRPLFGLIFPFSWFIAWLQLIKYLMANDDRKQEGRKKVLLHVIRKPPASSENRWLTEILNWKSLGFEPGLPRHNVIILPLVPPQFPTQIEWLHLTNQKSAKTFQSVASV